MFLDKYLNEFYFNQVIDNYSEEFLSSLNEYNFIQVYQVFKFYNFYFMDDIILKYLEIFTMDYKVVNNAIKNLQNNLGDKFVYIIGNDMKYLNEILNYES